MARGSEGGANEQPTNSSYFFIGRLDPPQLANFNIQNVKVEGDAVLEVFAHTIAIWWPNRPREDFEDLRDLALMWMRTVAAAYYLTTAKPLNVALVSWVEALNVDAQQAMIGVVDPVFAKVKMAGVRAKANVEMRQSIGLARRLRAAGGEYERATQEVLTAGNDATAESLLSAYRALECVRRTYEPRFEDRKEGWELMKADLGADEGLAKLLAAAAEAVRHGDRPETRRAPHPVNAAMERRAELLVYVRATVLKAINANLPAPSS